MSSTFRLILFVGFCLLSTVTFSQYHWVGGDGEWSDVSHWLVDGNTVANVPPGENDSVVIQGNPSILLNEDAFCHDLIVEGEETNISGNASIVITGDLHAQQGTLSLEKIVFAAGTHDLLLKRPFAGDLELNNGAMVSLLTNLSIGGTLTGDEVLLDLQGFGVHCEAFVFDDARAELVVGGSKILVESQLSVNVGVNAYETEPSIWPNESASINPGPLTVNTLRATTCGTGPGQTPFTITASVSSNYNGEDISCNGAEDGEATVSVVGGVGPFSYQWIGGNSPGFLQNYTGLGAGTYTVLVTDLGQGITCVDNVQLTEPPQLTVFDFIYTPPSCSGTCDGTGTPIVIGGVAPYNYNWGNGETTQTAFALCEGNNTLNFTDLNGCSFDTSFVVEVLPIYANLDITNVICNGTATGEVTANPAGGAGGPFQVDWSTGDSGLTVNGLDADSYTVTITDVGGCSYDTAFVITEEPPVTVTLDDSVDPGCAGDFDGSIEVSIAGGVGPYITDWTGPNAYTSTDEDISGLEAGSYNLSISDQNGCLASLSVQLDDPPAIDVTPSITDVGCFGDFSGAISITINGGTPNYSTAWTGPNGFNTGAEDIGGLEAGDYDLVVTDANDCQAFFTFTVDQPDEITAVETISEISCNGADDGAIDVVISGGTPNYTLDWVGPSGFVDSGTSINGLEPGTYDLTVTDDNGCQEMFSYSLEEPDPMDIEVAFTPVSCNGADDASIDITVTGGTEPYNYSWVGSNGFISSDEDLSDLEPATYDLTVTDDAGCQAVATVVIPEPDPLTLIPNITDLSCGGASDGAIDLSILGGTPNYTVEWIGPNAFTSTDEDISDLEAGDYDVTVTDLAGCQTTATFTVSENPPLEITINLTPITCNGADDASIDLEINGGQPPYDVSWAGPNLFVSTNEDISDLEPGFYNVLVVDQNGCFIEGGIDVSEPEAIAVAIDSVNPLCAGEDTGSITLTITGGVAPYTVNWDSGDSGEAITDLPAGDYVATVVDDSGCTFTTETITLDEAPAIDVVSNVSHVDCAGDDNGSIELTLSGGTGVLDISWIGPNAFVSTDEDISGLEPGTYDLTVTDELGCTYTEAITVSENSPIDVDFATVLPVCADDLISIDITISGGTGPYNVLWTGPDAFTSTDEDIVDEAQGVYTLEIVDALGCIYTDTADLSAPDPLTIDAVVTELDCTGDPIGAIDLTISGGAGPYDISWISTNGFTSTDEDISGLEEGSYEVTVTDNIGCEVVQVFDLVQPLSLDVDASLTDPLCNAQNTGAIEITISGGTAPYNVIWNGPNAFSSTSEDISNLEAGVYDLVVTDSGNCDAMLSFELIEPDPISVDASITNVQCGGGATGAIEIEITGGTGPYTTVWSAPGFNSVDEDIFDLSAGSYQLDIQDAQGCVFSQSFDVSEETPVDLTIDSTDSTCGNNSGSALANTSGGIEPISVEWFDENMVSIGNGDSISDLASGNYFATATDANGCFLTQAFTISDSDAVQLDATSTDPLCNGDFNGVIDLTITGGTGNLTIEWVGPNAFNANAEDISDLEAGDYTVTVTDELGCQSSLLVTLTQPETLALTAMATPVSCGETDNGGIDLTIDGGTADYIIEWNGPNTFNSDQEDISNLEAGSYNLLVVDANACVATLTVEVNQTTSVEASFVVTNISCSGDNDGSISTTIESGLAPFDFLWTGPNTFSNTNADIALLEPGDYNLVVTDALGCSLDTTLTVSENPEITLDIVTVQPACLASDGSLEAVVSGGQVADDYFYFWYDLDNGNILVGTDALLEDIPSGSYFVEVFDDLGCSASAEITLADNAGELDANITPTLCYGDGNGAIDLTVSGATEPYVFDWSGPDGFNDANEDIADLLAGDYSVEVTDAIGCLLAGTFTVDEPDSLMAQLTSGDLLCADTNNGTILNVISGGTEPYTITWTNADGFTSTDQNLSDLAAGCYFLEVVDINGCLLQDTACVNAPDSIAMEAILTDIACFSDSTGSIEIEVSGGVGGFTYEWTGPGSFTSDQEDIFNLPAGGYELSITDLNFCTLDTLLVLAQNPQIVLDLDTILPSCPGVNDGELSVQVSGGIAPYTIEWYEEDVLIGDSNAISGLSAGDYIISVSDAFMCQVSDTISLPEPEPFELDTVITDISCFGLDNGSIEILISGGQEPYSTFWIGPNTFSSTSEDIFNLEIGTYELTLGDANGCVQVFSFDINEPDPIEVSITSMNQASCLTSSDGSILIDIIGGTPEYTVIWTDSSGETSEMEDLENVGTDTYGFVVTDLNGCEYSLDNIPLGYSGDVTADAGPDLEFCFGLDTLLLGSNTGSDLSFWADSLGNEIVDGDIYNLDLDPGNYEFIYVAQDGDCISQDTALVTVFGLPEADAGPDQQVYFEEQTVIGGAPTTADENLFVWSPGDALIDDEEMNPTTIELVENTIYVVEVTDLNGCVSVDSVFITVIPELDVPSGFTPNGDNMNDLWLLGNNLYYPSLQVEIYNRWGDLLYREDRGYVNPWDGTYNGNPLPIGTYYYVISINEPEFKTTLTGPVTIIR